MILVSACLLGLECRYDGSDNKDDGVVDFLKDKAYMPVCPEQMGGLTTPREPAEITHEGDIQKVYAKDGTDVTAAFEKGAQETLKLKMLTGAEYAILKATSPSCGSRHIYDGSFSKKLLKGEGLTAEVLRNHGVCIFNEKNYTEMRLLPQTKNGG